MAKRKFIGFDGPIDIEVSSAGAISTTVSGGGGTQYTEDAVAAADPVGTMLIAVRRDTLSASEVSADGDNIALKASAKGELRVSEPDTLAVSGSVTSAATLFTQDMDGFQSITVQVTSAGTSCTITYETSDDNTNWQSASGLISSSSATTVPVSTSTTAILLSFPRRGRYFRARVSTYGSGTVTVVGTLTKAPFASPLHAVAISGTAVVLATGQAAHDAAISNNPLRIGARALTANYTAVATGDTADTPCTLVGAIIQKPYSIPEADWSYAAAASGIVNTTTAVTIKAADGTHRNYITAIQIMAEALGTATEVAVRDGAGGTVLWRIKIGTGGLTGGLSMSFPSPLRGTAATLLEVVTLTASGTGAVYFNAQGFVAP